MECCGLCAWRVLDIGLAFTRAIPSATGRQQGDRPICPKRLRMLSRGRARHRAAFQMFRVAVLLPERFRGGCSFGADTCCVGLFQRQSEPMIHSIRGQATPECTNRIAADRNAGTAMHQQGETRCWRRKANQNPPLHFTCNRSGIARAIQAIHSLALCDPPSLTKPRPAPPGDPE